MKTTLFPVFNPSTNAFLFHKERSLVHQEGDWHKAIQANIIRLNDQGTYNILVQERSAEVDIGGNKFDQSLATQMCSSDNLSPIKTLNRGLFEELGIEKFEYIRIPNKMFIIKTYFDQQEMLNRELLHLYIIKLDKDKNVFINTPKIKNIHWMEWKQFLNFFNQDQSKFTKTARFYFSNPKILEIIESYQSNFLGLSKKNTKNSSCFFHINKDDNNKTTHYFKLKDLNSYNYLFNSQ